MLLNSLSAAVVTFASLVDASFRVFDAYSPSIQINFGISSTCMTSLNSTVDCDAGTANLAAVGVDYNYWYQDNLTALCTESCAASLESWLAEVETACASDEINQSGILVQAKIVPLQYTYYRALACLQDSSDNWCLLESQSWQGSDYMRYDEDMCWQDDPPAICEDPDFDIDQVNTTMAAISNLYEPDLYCSECFMKMWRQRLVSPFLPNSSFTEYLVDQFENIQTECSTAMPYTTSASTLYVGMAPTTTTAISTATSTSTTCTGQLIQRTSGLVGCNQMSDHYNISTGDLQVATGNPFCEFDSEICLPNPCPLAIIVSYGTTCNLWATQLSNSTYNVTSSQFFGWNENIQGSCDYLAIDQRICTGPPGGPWVVSGSAYAPTATTAYHTTATPAAPTQVGSISDCGRYYNVAAGDTCNQIALVYGITFAQLRVYNPYLNDDCTNLWLGYAVCVAEIAPDPVSTDGSCGPSNDFAKCSGTSFGNCCSTSGYCGDGDDYCGAGNCYSGSCTGSSTATTNGTCGPDWGGLTCDNANFGPCCSIYGYCGTGSDFCGAGNCFSGNCDTNDGGPSINGECGPLFAGNKTCTGTQFGGCCSTSGYCGSTADCCQGSNCYSGACVWDRELREKCDVKTDI